MRYLSTKPALLIIVILSAALYLQRTRFTAGAESAPLQVNGEAAVAQLVDPPLAQLARLTAGDGAAADKFGFRVAVSGDTLVVGAPGDDIGANVVQGSAYVFVRSGGVWSFQQKLIANDGALGDQFGLSVAISGDTIIVGSRFDDIGAIEEQGSAYVFVRSGGVWAFQQKLIANDDADGDGFGHSVAMSGDTVVISAPGNDIGANVNQGSAYVFVRSGAVWSIQQKLTADDGAAHDVFGSFAVAISGDYILIGAPNDDSGANANQGAAYIFVRSGAGWTQQQKLTANDGAASDLFGMSVALDGNTALVGADFYDIGLVEKQGSAYLFSRSGTVWTQRQKLTAREGASGDFFGGAVALGGNTTIAGAFNAKVGANAEQGALYVFGCGYVEQQTLIRGDSAAGDYFGNAVAIDGDTAVVGAPFDDVGAASDQGAAYVFVRSGTSWTQMQKLTAKDGAAGDQFGNSVAISGDYLLIGAHWKHINGNLYQGAAYVFMRGGGMWTQQERLLADDGAAGDFFGSSVSISGARVAVGAVLDDIGGKQNQGAVYLFTLSGSTWMPEIKLIANDGAANDYFGSSVALAGDLLIAGAPGADINTNRDQGAAYLFESSVTPWRQRAKLTPDDGTADNLFGHSAALFGNTALVGAPATNNQQGAAYVFIGPRTPIGGWSEQARLMLSDGAAGDFLGSSVALSDNTAVVGAPQKNISGRTNQGAAFVFTRDGASWSLRQPIVADDGTAESRFGSSAAISGDTIVVGAVSGGSSRQGRAYVLKNNCGPPLAALASVSAASFTAGGELAPESITAGFGARLGDDTVAASSLPLPTTLGDLSVMVRDGAGVERLAPLFFVSPGQINYQIPAGTTVGPATVTVMNGAGSVASGEATIAIVAPGLFSADSSGQGVAAAFVLRIKADRSQSYEPVAQFDAAQNRFVPLPIDLGSETDQVFLVLYGTGLRFRSSLSAVSCTIGGTGSEVLFAGVVPEFVGLDQVNVHLPRSLAGRGEVDVVLVLDGKTANTVRISIL